MTNCWECEKEKLLIEVPKKWLQTLQAFEKNCPDGLSTSDQIILAGKVCEEPKTGHWIMPIQDDGMSDPIYYQVRCSKCGFDLDPQTWHIELHQRGADKYCPACGAKMESEEGNEESN